MFTGIIEDLGEILAIIKGPNSAVLRIRSPLIVKDVKRGDSIAVNGICLTVTEFDAAVFMAEAMAETLAKTNLGELRPGEKVNLERALRLGDRLGGHLVSGHVDGVGVITRQTKHDIALVTEITYPPHLGRYLAPKGSIAIDGISLTVMEVNEKTFSISLIPHTRGITTLGTKKTGDKVNLEGDMIAKYLEKLMAEGSKGDHQVPSGGLSLDFLSNHGFV